MPQRLDLDLSKETAHPYFLWDEPITVAEFRALLKSTDPAVRAWSLQRLLREARFDDVWKFITPQEVANAWDQIRNGMGRRRSFWEFILKKWHEHGLIR